MSFLAMLLVPVLAQTSYPSLQYKAVDCVYSFSGKEQKRVSQKLMTLVIETDLGRFAQIQFGDDVHKVQYQILLETDGKNSGAVNILQNLLVDKLESSAEFSAVKPAYAKLSQGLYSVRCDLITAPSAKN